MLLHSTSVALLGCSGYEPGELAGKIDQLCGALDFRVNPGSRVLLKPNLLTGRSVGHLACTHPVFVAAVAKWFVDQGAKVSIGDSPAFGTARGVMRVTGIEDAVAGLPVACINFDQSVTVRLAGGVTVEMARAALECDVLVNLPRVKTHVQLFITLAVKNYFGTVVGFQKPLWHLRYGNHAEQFSSHLVDLLQVLPNGLSLLDGVVVMEGNGPISGRPFPLGLVAGAVNPVALDTALLQILSLNHRQSPVWQACASRNLAGTDPDMLDYPLSHPAEFPGNNFTVPTVLKPISFNPVRMLVSACRRFGARLKESP
jgi:uncharacterized protein (DUF362 family)